MVKLQGQLLRHDLETGSWLLKTQDQDYHLVLPDDPPSLVLLERLENQQVEAAGRVEEPAMSLHMDGRMLFHAESLWAA